MIEMLDTWGSSCNTTLQSYIEEISNVVSNALSRSYVSSLACASTALFCEESCFLSKLRSPYVLDAHAATNLEKLKTSIQGKHYSVEIALLSF